MKPIKLLWYRDYTGYQTVHVRAYAGTMKPVRMVGMGRDSFDSDWLPFQGIVETLLIHSAVNCEMNGRILC